MSDLSDVENADRLSRRRARMLPILAVLFIGQQVTFFGKSAKFGASEVVRSVDRVHFAAWLILSIVILLALANGGSWIQPKRIRDLMNDESTKANRAEAFRVGFLFTMVAAIGLYFLDYFEPLSGRDAVHVLMSIGIGTALVRFGTLERRAHRDG